MPDDVLGLRRQLSEARERIEQLQAELETARELLMASTGDVDETAATRRALRHGELTNRTVAETLDATTDGIWSWNFVTDELFFSPRYYIMLGYEPGAFPATFEAWVDLLHPDDRDAAQAVARDYLAERPDVYRNEFRLRCADGSYRFMRSEAKVVQRDAAGAAVRLIGHHQDITERIEEQRRHEEIEAQLRQAQKLEAVGRLAGGVAHEFNNLLTVVAGNLSLARMDLGHDHPVRQLLGESLVATNRAAELTRQLLSFSRRQPVAPRAISLNEVVRHQAAMLQRTLGEQIRISVATDYGLARIHADLGQLEQVLLNLALNARDAMPGGGKLLLETAMVTFDDPPTMVHGPLKPGDYVMLAVQDSGHGIAPEHLDKIFDPFFSTRPVGSGSGLGLSMVIGAVEQIGASIQVESTAGHGTVFRIYFPALQGAVRAEGGAPVEVAARPQDDESPQGHETILVVEDEAIVRRMTVMALRRCGYTVVEAASGPEALLQVRTRDEPVDLVLTDVVMPRMDGRELVRQLHERTPDLPVLYTSGYGEDVIARHGVLDEGVELLVKPFDPAMLARRVRELLDR